MTADEPLWAARFRAPRITLPGWAIEAPQRCMYASTATGVVELYTWDRDTDTQRQATDRPYGTYIGALDPSGEHLWWFADSDGDEWGTWMRQPFEGGEAIPALPGLDAGYPAGLAIGSGVVVAGRSTDTGTAIHLVREGYEFKLYESEHDAFVGGLSRDESLLCLAHAERGDSRHRALRVVQLEDGTPIGELWDGPGKDLSPSGFAPIKGDTRLLVNHERYGRPQLLIWDPVAGTEDELSIDLPGDVDADWCPDGYTLLISHDYAARTELYRYDITFRELSRVDTPPGVVSGATARPDGTIEFAWSSSASPPVIRSSAGAVLLRTPGEPPPDSVSVEDIWIDGPGGRVHALMARPAHLLPPYSAIFALHGGPDLADDDAFRPRRAAWVDAGYCVVHVNYRGSAGYGSAWRDALEGRPGLTELEDVFAVRDWVVGHHLVNAQRCVIAGGSWGGYLSLLGLGTRPELWAAGIAAGPIANYLAAYEEEMEPLRSFDRAIFGGSPDEVRESYVRSSPISYIEKVDAPVLILAGTNDPRCPIGQVESYVARLQELGKEHEVYRYDAGHGSLVVEEQIRQMQVEIDFARRHCLP